MSHLALVLIIVVAMIYGMFAIAVGVNDCDEWRWRVLPVEGITGWRDDGHVQVKCYEGQVVDYRPRRSQ